MKELAILLLQIFWCFPQTILGSLMLLYFNLRKKVIMRENYHHCKVIYVKSKKFSGISLGRYIILNSTCYGKSIHLMHEYGHTIQSYIFGWLYLFVIGIPSIILAIMAKIYTEVHDNYYLFYPEEWADKLGGVKR